MSTSPILSAALGAAVSLVSSQSGSARATPAASLAPLRSGVSAEAPRYVNVEEAALMLKNSDQVLLLDVRTPGEFRAGHLPGALHIPLQELFLRYGELGPHRDKTIIVYCRTQNRSAVARSWLVDRGFRATFLKGGVSAWARDGRALDG